MSASASGAQPNGGPGNAKQRGHDDGSSSRAFTVEQKAAVIRIRKCKATAFYDILGLEETKTTCSDGEIKKAYRKLSLLTHPDKNGYDGADEAFKMVSRAFQILSDADKKAKYDRFGVDPDSRFSSAAASSPFSGFSPAGARRGGPMFDEEISPEELFRQFFGGGMGGGAFGNMGGMGMGGMGPGFVFNMGGGPGIRIHQFGGGVPQRRPHNHDRNGEPARRSPLETFGSLIPLLFLFVLPLLSSLFSGATSTKYPSMRFDAAVPPHTLSHTSARLAVPYWVNPAEVADYSSSKWKELDKVAEGKYVGQLNAECEWELEQRQRLANEAQGFFFTDYEALERARRMEMPSCRRYQQLTGRRYA